MFLYQSHQVYALDKMAVELDGLPEIELMQRAGDRVWKEVSARWPNMASITIFAGSGNNGGDAYVVGLRALEQGVAVQLICKGDLSRQSATAAHFYQLWLLAGGSNEPKKPRQQLVIEGEVIVDGLLGIGLSRELDQETHDLITAINQHPVPKVAIDIPSGLNADTGIAQPVAVQADMTVTFIACKIGQFLADGPDLCGELVFDDLGISSGTAGRAKPALEILDENNIVLPAIRNRNSHKNQFGHVLVIGGDRGMSGAALLAAHAALRAGAGVVSVLVHAECVQNLTSIPELMVKGWHEFDSIIERATVIVVGPGLGQGAYAKAILNKLTRVDKPMVVDASALTTEFLDAVSSRQIVITPHPGEAAGLLSTTSAQVQRDRVSASQQLINRFAVVSVLKGSGSLIQQANSLPAINVRGHAGMATAGMGDVLAGLIAALIGQNLSLFDAAKTAVLLHALCAEAYLQEHDEVGLIASDVIEAVPVIIKQLRSASSGSRLAQT